MFENNGGEFVTLLLKQPKCKSEQIINVSFTIQTIDCHCPPFLSVLSERIFSAM